VCNYDVEGFVCHLCMHMHFCKHGNVVNVFVSACACVILTLHCWYYYIESIRHTQSVCVCVCVCVCACLGTAVVC